MGRALVGVILGMGTLAAAPAAEAQIVAPAGRTLFNRTVMIRTFLRVDSFAEGVPGLRVLAVTNPYAVVWGAYPHLSLTFVAPLVSIRSDAPASPGQDFTTTSFADGLIFARYDLMRKNVPGGFTRLSPEVGVKVPSGGAFSTGSTDPIGALNFTHVRDPHWLIADVQFTRTTAGDNGVRLGSRWNFDAGYLHRVFPRGGLGIPFVLLVLELNGEHVGRARLPGTEILNSGGNLLFLSPGVEFQPTNRLLVEFSSPIPVVRDLNGKQLRPTSSFILGARWLF